MTRLHHPVSIPGLLGTSTEAGTALVLTAKGVVALGGGVNLLGIWLCSTTPLPDPGPPNSEGDAYICDDTGDLWIWDGDEWVNNGPADPSYFHEPHPTGVYTGAAMSEAGTVLTVAAGTGVIADSYTDQLVPTFNAIAWVEQVIDFGSITDRAYSFPWIDATGTLGFDIEAPLPDELRTKIYLGRAVHDISTGDLVTSRPEHLLPGQTSQMFADFMYAIKVPFLFEGGKAQPNNDLTFGTSDSRWFGPAESWQQDKNDPNIANNPGADPQSFLYVDALGVLLTPAGTTLVDPASYEDPLGTIVGIPGSNNRASIQRLYTSISGIYLMQYGQQWYNNLEDARNAINSDNATFVTNPYIEDASATLVAYFVMEKGATDLSDGADVIIISPDGVPLGGGTTGAHTHDSTYLRLDAGNDPMLAALDMGSFNINNLLDPVLDQDAATKKYVDDQDPHDLYSTRHTDVDVATPLVDRHVLAVPIGVGDWEPEFRMNWRNVWGVGTYYTHDVVRDSGWSMVANKETTERAAPQPVGSPSFVYNGVGGTTSQVATDITFGNRYTFNTFGTLEGFRIYTIIGNEYSVYTIQDPLGTPIITLIANFVADTTGWRSFPITPAFVGNGVVLDLVATVVEPDPTPTVFTGNWDYDTPPNPGVPGSGEIIQSNATPGVMAISKTDDDGGDRSGELAGLTTGDIIQYDTGVGTRYVIQAIGDQGTYINFSVAPAVQSAPDGVTNFAFETVTATPITYFLDTDYWLSSPFNVQGYLQIENGAVAINDTAYGTDLFVQEYDVPDDWDVLAVPASGSGGGGSGGGVEEAPVDGTPYERQDAGWVSAGGGGGGPFLELAGGTMAGIINMGGFVIENLGTPTANANAATKLYVDGFLPLTGGLLTGALLVERAGTQTQVDMTNLGGTHHWRFRVLGTGQLNLQSAPIGTSTWTTVESWVPA